MEKEYKISWLKVLGITLLIVIVIALFFLIMPKNKSNATSTEISNNYINNINMMKQAGFEYFQGSNLPVSVGESNRISLNEMINTNLIIDFTEGYTCNKEDSYIQATKTLDNEYAMKVSLNCEDKSDYIVTTIANDVVCTDCNQDNKSNSAPVYNDNYSDNTGSNGTGTVVNNYYYNNSSNGNSNNNSYSGNYSNSGSKSYRSEKTTIYKTITTTTRTDNIRYVNNCDNNDCRSEIYYTVNFDSMGGSYVARQIVKQGSTAVYMPSYKTGYKFLGWYLNGEKYDFATPVYKRITLIAKWQKIDEDEKNNIYDVDFDSNGGSYVRPERVEENHYVIRPNNPTKACYDFGGWYLDKNLTRRYNFNTPVTKDFTLYAKWIPNDTCKNIYTVRFVSNGGTSVSSQRVEAGDRAYKPSNPTRSGYRFIGWYTSNSFTNFYNFNNAVYRNITLYAKWEKDEVLYHTYCKKVKERFYSWSYTSYRSNMSPYSYDWTIKFDNLTNAKNVKITNLNYVSDYSTFLYEYANNRRISMVGENGAYRVFGGTLTSRDVREYSLKGNNFAMNLSNPYKSGSSWYTNAYVTVRNYNGATKYYYSAINGYIYFVPFYFDIEYTNLNNCVKDKASNSSRYSNYEIVKTYYE